MTTQVSAVEQAREGLRAAYHAWWSDQTPISVVMAAEEKLIAAVRAERDAAWREGMEAAIAKVPRFRMVRQVKSATGYSVQMTHHDERKHKNEPKCVYGPDVVAALAALAARMEAK